MRIVREKRGEMYWLIGQGILRMIAFFLVFSSWALADG
jgi:hypothetical protein